MCVCAKCINIWPTCAAICLLPAKPSNVVGFKLCLALSLAAYATGATEPSRGLSAAPQLINLYFICRTPAHRLSDQVRYPPMVSHNQHAAFGSMVLSRELSALQLAGVQPEQPPRVSASDQLCHTEEVYERQAGQTFAQREHVGLLLVPGIFASDWQIQHVAGAHLSRHA